MQFFQDVQTLFLTFLSFPSSIFCSFAGCWSYSISMEIWVKKIASPAIRGLRWPQSIQSKFVFLFFGSPPPPILIAHHDYFWELICLVGLKCFCINITQKCRKTRVHTLLWLMSLILALDMHQPHTPPQTHIEVYEFMKRIQWIQKVFWPLCLFHTIVLWIWIWIDIIANFTHRSSRNYS